MLRTLEKLGLLLGFIGLSIAGYLLYTHIAGTEIVCGLSSCGIVNGSKWANFLGLPVSAWGFTFYIVVITLILAKQAKLLFYATIGGLIFSAYLTALEAFVIHAWCQWCLMSAWISLALFIIAYRNLIPHKKEND